MSQDENILEHYQNWLKNRQQLSNNNNERSNRTNNNDERGNSSSPVVHQRQPSEISVENQEEKTKWNMLNT